MERKYELTELTDIPEKKIEEMINLMTKNKTGEIIQLIKNSLEEEEKEELRLNIQSAQYIDKPSSHVICYMNLYNYAIFHSSKELYDVLVNNQLIPPKWYNGLGLVGNVHPLALAIILNNRIFLSYYLATNDLITSANKSKSLIEALNITKMLDEVNVCNTENECIDTIKWVLNLSRLPENFYEFYTDTATYCETETIVKKNFEEVSHFRNNLFTMFKAYKYDEGSSASALNKDAILEMHKGGFR